MRRPRRRTFLTLNHRRNRVQWADNKLRWNLTWILCKNQKIPIGVQHATSGIFLILCV